jgi:antitoxin VapB
MISLSRETEALAQRLAVAHNVSIDQAIRVAPEEKARAERIVPEPFRSREQTGEAIPARRAHTDKFVTDLAAMPILDPRSPDEIMDDLNAL